MPEPQRILYAGLWEETAEVSVSLNSEKEVDIPHLTDELGDLLYYYSEIGYSKGVRADFMQNTRPFTLHGAEDSSAEDLDSVEMLQRAVTQVLLAMDEGAAETFEEFGQPATMAGCLSQFYKAIMRVAEEHGITLDDIIKANTEKLNTRTRDNTIIGIVKSQLEREQV